MTPALEAAYEEPHRRYHTRAHIEDCLSKLARVAGLTAADRRTLEYAIWWHDAVYDPHRSDNEEASADMARRDLASSGVDRATIEEVARLILLTKGHIVATGDRMGAIMVSIDLSILGEAPEVYDAYAKGVRAEYAHLPKNTFKAGRRRVLEGLLNAPALFADPILRDRYETSARANLAREIASLA